MTVEMLSAVAGTLLSLAAAYVPGWSAWYAGLDSLYKRLVMLGMLALAAGGSLGVACAGWGGALGVPETPTCDAPGALGGLRAFIAALTANQAAYLLAVRPASGGGDADFLAALESLTGSPKAVDGSTYVDPSTFVEPRKRKGE